MRNHLFGCANTADGCAEPDIAEILPEPGLLIHWPHVEDVFRTLCQDQIVERWSGFHQPEEPTTQLIHSPTVSMLMMDCRASVSFCETAVPVFEHVRQGRAEDSPTLALSLCGLIPFDRIIPCPSYRPRSVRSPHDSFATVGKVRLRIAIRAAFMDF